MVHDDDIVNVVAFQVSAQNKKHGRDLPLYPNVYTVDIDQVLKRKAPVGYLQSDKCEVQINFLIFGISMKFDIDR